MKPKVFVTIIVLFLVAYLIRVMYLPQMALTFGYDQARDAIISQQIASGDWKILGPPASTPGLHHGVLYYYILAPAYAIGGLNPLSAAYWIAFINAATIFIVFYLSKLLTKSTRAALLSAFLFAISFEASQYAVWLSNPTIAIFSVPLCYLGLWMWINNRSKWAPIIAGIGLGLSIQAEIFLLYHIVPILLWLWIARKNINHKQVVLFTVALLVSISTMILVELKFGFKAFQGIASLTTTQDAVVAAKGLGDVIVLFFNQIGRVFSFNSYPGNVGYGAGLVIAMMVFALYSWKRNKLISWQPFLVTWLLSHTTVVSLGGTSTPFLLVGIGPAVSILLGISLHKIWKIGYMPLSLFILGVLLYGNLSMISKENPKGQTIFAIQKDMLLSKQLKAIDYTYEKAQNQPFTLNTVTSPLWVNIVWTYLYDWYGEEKYGYKPDWHGRDQVGQLVTLNQVKNPSERYFLLIEPLDGIPLRFVEDTLALENSRSTILDEKNVGSLTVQYRELK